MVIMQIIAIFKMDKKFEYIFLLLSLNLKNLPCVLDEDASPKLQNSTDRVVAAAGSDYISQRDEPRETNVSRVLTRGRYRPARSQIQGRFASDRYHFATVRRLGLGING